MINYFNRFGRVWQVYVQADGEFRTVPENVGQFYVKNATGEMAPLSTLVSMETVEGPEFTMRFNGYRGAQLFVSAATGYSSGQVMQALEEVFKETMPVEMGYDYIAMSFQEKVAAEGVPASVIFGFSLLFVFLILAAQYESWALPFSVLIGTPIAVFGAFGTLYLFKLVAPQASENDVFVQIGLVMLIGLSAKNAILIIEFAKEEYATGQEHHGRRAGRRQAAAAPDSHDGLRIHPRRGAADSLVGRGRACTHPPRPRGVRRDDGGKPDRHLSGSGLLLCGGDVGASRRETREAKTWRACAGSSSRRPATGNSPIRPRGRCCRQPLYLRADIKEEGTEMDRERDGRKDRESAKGETKGL